MAKNKDAVLEACELYKGKLLKEIADLNEKLNYNAVEAERKLNKKLFDMIDKMGALHQNVLEYSEWAAKEEKKIKRIRAWQMKNMAKAIEEVVNLEMKVERLDGYIYVAKMKERRAG